MSLSKVKALLEPIGTSVFSGDLSGLDQLQLESLGVFCFSDVRPLQGAAGFLDWRVCGSISRRMQEEAFCGHVNEVMLLPANSRLGQQRIFLFGLGSVETCTNEILREGCMQALHVMERAGVTNTAFLVPATFDKPSLPVEFAQIIRKQFPEKISCVIVAE